MYREINIYVLFFWLDCFKGYEMSRTKIGAMITSVLFSAAGFYLVWWLSEVVSELVAAIAFLVLFLNYYWIMRNFKKLRE